MADFQSLWPDFETEGIGLVAASVDPLEKARALSEELGLAYHMGFGLDMEEISRLTGAFYERDRKIIHGTGFLLHPNRSVQVACYSTGAIGRLAAADVLKLVRFYMSKK